MVWGSYPKTFICMRQFSLPKLMNIKLPGGFNQIEKNEKFLKRFMAILDLNGAKGRRKYLRLDTRGERDVSGYMTFQGKLFTINIKDISSAGFAITYKPDIVYLFQKNTHIRNLCISAGRKSMVCSCIVFNTQMNQDGTAMSVLMLTNENPPENITYIRDYIFKKYDEKMNQLLDGVDKDMSSYSDTDEYSKILAVRDRNYDELIPVNDDEEEGNGADSESQGKSLLSGNLDEDIL